MEYEKLKNARHIWIYGAGVYGRQAADFFSMNVFHLPIEGVVVTYKEKCRQVINDYKVLGIDEIRLADKNTVFVIAVSIKYQKDVINELESRGYCNYTIWNSENIKYLWKLADYKFENRKKNCEKVCFILSGYKEFLWIDVFNRLKKFATNDIDICILSSGLYSKKLSDIAGKNNWSYLSTEVNDLTMIQNIAITLFSNAEWIWKMDEDIFLTEGCFENLFQMWNFLEKKEPYHLGILAPLINVNGYGYIRILNYLQKIETYEKRFERAFYGGNSESMIEKSADAAKFMWGYGDAIPKLDDLNKLFSEHKSVSYCNVRFSIGFILFRRQLWDEMGGFKVSGYKDFGIDEIQLCEYCMINSFAIAVAENIVVGHFSFGQQMLGMKEFYKKNPEFFQIN